MEAYAIRPCLCQASFRSFFLPGGLLKLPLLLMPRIPSHVSFVPHLFWVLGLYYSMVGTCHYRQASVDYSQLLNNPYFCSLHVETPKLPLVCQIQSFEQQLVNKHFEIRLAGTICETVVWFQKCTYVGQALCQS